MADTKITGLTAYTSPVSTDVLPIVDISGPTTKKITFANLLGASTSTMTNKTITDSTNNVTANGLRSATTTVSVSAATAPSSGQVLTATASTTATWQTPTPSITAASNITSGVDQSQSTSNATYAVGEANATTKHSFIAEKFVPTVSSIQGVKLWKIADTGSFTGTVKISLQADSGGNPSGSDLASYTITNAAWLKLNSAAEFAIAFSTEYTALTVGNSYWIVVTPSTSDNSNHPNLGSNSAGGYASGALKYNNSTDGWVLTATTILYFKTTIGILGKVIQTGSSSGLPDPNVRSYSLISSDTTAATVSSTTTATTVFSKQFEGGFMSANTGLKIRVFADVNQTSSTGAGHTTVQFNYNGTTICSVAGSQDTTSTNGVATWAFTVDAIILNNSSVSVQVVNLVSVGTPTAGVGTPTAATLLSSKQSSGTTTNSVDFSSPGLFEIVFVNSTASNLQSRYYSSVIEKIG